MRGPFRPGTTRVWRRFVEMERVLLTVQLVRVARRAIEGGADFSTTRGSMRPVEDQVNPAVPLDWFKTVKAPVRRLRLLTKFKTVMEIYERHVERSALLWGRVVETPCVRAVQENAGFLRSAPLALRSE